MKSLKLKGTKIIADLFTRIASNTVGEVDDDLDKLLQGMLKTGSKTHLPLGYQTLDHPNENVCCDWPSLTLTNTEAFHKICTGHVNYCLICNAHLKNETFRPPTSSKSSILGEHNAGKKSSSGDTSGIDDDDENDFAIKISEEKSNDLSSFSPDITETDISFFKIGSFTKIILP